jgi:hypothetical protein
MMHGQQNIRKSELSYSLASWEQLTTYSRIIKSPDSEALSGYLFPSQKAHFCYRTCNSKAEFTGYILMTSLTEFTIRCRPIPVSTVNAFVAFLSKILYKSKGKRTAVLVHATKVYRVNKGVTLLILNLGARRWWWSTSLPGCFPPLLQITSVRIEYGVKRVSQPVWAFYGRKKIVFLSGLEPRIVQTVAQSLHCIRYPASYSKYSHKSYFSL